MHGSIESLPPVFVSERDLRHLTALVEGRRILAPLATALLGLRVGARIEWETPSGRSFVWQVLGVDKERPAT